MSKAYICNCCDKAIADPYKAKIKEFYIGTDYELCGVFPVNRKNTTRIHLCEDCCKGLKAIGARIRLSKINSDFDFLETIRELSEENIGLLTNNEILSQNAATAFQDGLNEARELYEKEVKNKIRKEFFEKFDHETRGVVFSVEQMNGMHSALDTILGELEGDAE